MEADLPTNCPTRQEKDGLCCTMVSTLKEKIFNVGVHVFSCYVSSNANNNNDNNNNNNNTNNTNNTNNHQQQPQLQQQPQPQPQLQSQSSSSILLMEEILHQLM